MSKEAIEVRVRYKDVEKTISGDAEQVIRELLSFLSKIVPQIELLSQIALTVDVNEFLLACKGIFAITPEGTVTTARTESLTDRENIMLHLVKARFGFITKKNEKDSVTIGDLIGSTKSSAGTVAGRLSEMCSEGLVERVGKGEYRITTYGLDFFIKNIASKIKPLEGGV
ncbi:MAG: hypothetical protein QW265_04700 [Candidatus Bathyarchaeia archaeon]